MASKIGLGLALDGESEFRQGLKNVNLELKLLDAQTKQVSLQYADNANSLEALSAKNDILLKQLEQQEKKLELNKKQLDSWQEVNKKAALRVEELKKELSDAEEEMKTMEKSSTATEEELKKQKETIEKLSKELKTSEQAFTKSEDKIAKYKVSVSQAEVGLTKLSVELKNNEKYLTEARESTDELADSIDKYGKKTIEAKEDTKVFGDVLKANLASEAIISGMKKIANGIGEITKATVRTGADFETSMSQVAATMGMTSEEIAQGSEAYKILEQAAEESGKATKYTASQAAEALNYLALAGYDAQKAAATLPYVLNLAAAGNLDLAYASDLVTDSMAALNLKTDQLENYIDQLAKTSQKSNTSIAQLGEGSLIAAGMAEMTGQAIETLNAELGVLANRGIKGAEGGTHLRNILLSLVHPTEDGANALKDMGVAVIDSVGNVRDLNDIMVDLNGELSTMSESDKTNIIGTIFNKTDIAAVNALLKGTGEEFNQLRDELISCEGAASDMAETMQANLTGKVTVFQSALEGLGITAYKKIEGTLKESVDSATGAVGRLQSSMDNGKLGVAMDDFAEALGVAADGAIDFGEDALPVLINGLTWVMENSDFIISCISGFTAAGLNIKVVAPAVQTVTTAWQAYKTANEGATIAQWLLNGAMNANPVGILTTALLGLTAAVTTYSFMTDSATKEVQKFREENEQLIETQQNSLEEMTERNESLQVQEATVQRLTEELTELNEKEKLTAQDKARIKGIVEQLNQVMPELNLTINEQTGYLNQSTDAMRQYVASSKDAMLLAAAQETMTDIAKELYEAETILSQKEQERIENQERMKELQEQLDEASKNKFSGPGWKTIDGWQEELEILTGEQEVLNQTIKEQKNIVTDITSEYEKAESNAQKYANAISESAEVLAAAEETQITYKDNVYTVSAEVAESIGVLEEAYAEAKTEAMDSLNSQVGLFDELSTKSEMSISQMVEHLKSQTDAFTNYTENLRLASEIAKNDTTGNFSQIVTSISELGIAGAGYLDELVNAYQNNTNQFNQILSEWESATIAKDTLASTLSNMKTGYEQNASELIGIEALKGKELVAASESYGQEMAEAYGRAGSWMVEDTEKSMKAMTDAAHEGGEDVSKETQIGAKESVEAVENEWQIKEGESQSFKALGSAAVKGLAAGIKENQLEAVSATVRMAEMAYLGAKDELQINSPSKKFEYLAEMSVEGYKNRFMVQMKEAMASIDDIMHPEANGTIIVKNESNPEITNLTRLLEEYLPECAKAKTIIPVRQLSKEMNSSIDKNMNINAIRKERYN